MSNKFKCKIKDNKLIIEPRPNGKTTISVIRDLLKNNPLINEIIICEGIEVIGVEYFSNLDNIVKVTLPNSIKIIGCNSFSFCRKLKEISFPNNPAKEIIIDKSAFEYCSSLENLNIENGVTKIGDSAFCHCTSLKNVYFPDSLTTLGDHVFHHCPNLKKVNLSQKIKEIQPYTFCDCDSLEIINLPNSIKKIGNYAFLHCSSLKDVSLPDNLEIIEDNAFSCCDSLKFITLPSNLKRINYSAFSNCYSLTNIEFSEGLEQIDSYAFSECIHLKNISLPSSLVELGDRAFWSCVNLKRVIMNDGVTKMGESVFEFCSNLEDITLSNNLKEIPLNTFYDCFNLRKIVIPDNVQTLHAHIFHRCKELKEVVLSKNLKTIPIDAFDRCDGLEKIVIPEGVEEIEQYAFSYCVNLNEVYLPTTLKRIDRDAFLECKNLSYLYLKSKGEIIRLNVYRELRKFVRNKEKLLFLYNVNNDTYGFYKDGEYTEFSASTLLNNDKIVKLIEDNRYSNGMYIKLYLYSKKKFVPSNIVIENMPLDDIDKFYINNNDKEWAKLVKASVNVNLDENKSSFFKLCYVLGVFSESTSIRDRAIKFLNEKIVNVLDGYTIHSKFDGFDLSNGFNEEYAEFFIKYYNHHDFMKYIDEYDDEIDLMTASYNNFKNVKKIYPNKTLHTNREADLLLPEHVMYAVKITEYNDVNEGNEEFALTVGRYGYNQEQFEKLQEWYNFAKNIKKENMRLFISNDEEKNEISYKLLDKTDPLCAVLGNITNCCQVVDGVGEECVEYGLTMPNSGFITFNYNDKIIGQSWVWYDENNKIICLDNIEIPHRYLEKIHQNKTIQKSFIDCLLRIEKNFKEEMNKRGLEVKKVTIGQGYNDIKEILDKNFVLTKASRKLSDYDGYSDASSQYEIKFSNTPKRR